ncbi:MAG: DUF4147 domain-containing protein [Patescibacteria group bacterium]|nr:DUF4147 domain-containing protein [bacterium]MDZ4240959.1 DUF4147 domain-containing protein [Patescibacteria group bacterium]
MQKESGKKIKNFGALAHTPERKAILSIAEAGLNAIDTETVFKKGVSLKENFLKINNTDFSLSSAKRLFIVGVGKSSAIAARTLEETFGDRLSGGIVLSIDETFSSSRITYLQGDHPFPTKRNVDATEKIIAFLKERTKDDMVIFIVSGGGSALLSQPQHIAVEDEAELIKELFKKGATIQELNTVRKHLSFARGGFLAQYTHPASAISLIMSDVPGNDLEFISSGPTVKDNTTIHNASEVLKKYSIHIVPDAFVETPKDDLYFKSVSNILFLSNKTALEAMKNKASELGYTAEIVTDSLSGEAQDVGVQIIEKLHHSASRTVLLYGGETTVTMKGEGVGGRNQELVLAALSKILDGENLLAIASDGKDNTTFAGALCDTITLKKAQEMGLDVGFFLTHYDSMAFWEKTGDFIQTGPTSSNVSDLIIALKK